MAASHIAPGTYYNQLAKLGYSDRVSTLAGRPGQKSQEPLIRRFLRDQPQGALIVDVGGALGDVGQLARGFGHTVHPCDVAVDALQGQAGALAADCRCLPLRSQSVDAMLHLFVIIHIDEVELGAAMAEMRRVLRPGGSVLLASNVESGSAREFLHTHRLGDLPDVLPPTKFVSHNLERLREEIARAGLKTARETTLRPRLDLQQRYFTLVSPSAPPRHTQSRWANRGPSAGTLAFADGALRPAAGRRLEQWVVDNRASLRPSPQGTCSPLDFGRADVPETDLRIVDRVGSDKHSIEQSLQAMLRFEGGRELFASADLQNSRIGFVRTEDWTRFCRLSLAVTGEVPNPEAPLHRLWIRDGDQTRVLLVIPESFACKEASVLVELRRQLGFYEVNQPFDSAVDAVVRRVDRELARLPDDRSDPRYAGHMKGLLDLLLRSDLGSGLVRDRMEKLLTFMRNDRQRYGRTLSQLTLMQPDCSATFERVRALEREGTDVEAILRARADLESFFAIDERVVAMYLRRATRRARAHQVVTGRPDQPVSPGGRPEWFEALKALMRREVAEEFQHFLPVGEVQLRVPHEVGHPGTWVPPPEHEAAFRTLLQKAQDPEGFATWLGGFMDELADRMMKSPDPLVQESWRARRFAPDLIKEIIGERAARQGWPGIFTIDAHREVLTGEEFSAILRSRQLIYDPIFGVDYSMGLHGELIHAFSWVYLSEDPEEAGPLQALYGSLGLAPEDQPQPVKGTDVWAHLLDGPRLFFWLLTPCNWHALTEVFVGAY